MRVALIFDDGPDAELTPQILSILARANLRVSFAYIGRNVVAQPKLAAAAHEVGHEIINHTFTHPRLPELQPDFIRQEIIDTQKAIERATGYSPRWLWAPYGHWSAQADSIANDLGVPHVPKTIPVVSTEDWNRKRDAEFIYQCATTQIQDGSIINFHEWRAETLAKLPAIIAELQNQNCQFLTLSELVKANATSASPFL